MPVAQVDCAEPVEVDQDQATPGALAREVVQHGHKGGAVGEAGQLVGHRGGKGLAF